MKNLLVVVDMVNGFVNCGALADYKINKITPNIIALIEEAKASGTKIVAFRDCHNKGDEEFKVFPEHCLNGTYESELILELLPYQKDFWKNIGKQTTNGFITKEFQEIIKENNFDNVYVTGCCTDICVKGFTESYLKYIKENNLNTKIVVVDDACYTFDNENHNAFLCHNKTLAELEKQGAEIAQTEDLVEIL